MHRLLTKGASIICLLLSTAACASLNSDPVVALLRDPIGNDGRVFELTAYPHDLLSDPDRYVLCLDRCDAVQADRAVVVLLPRQSGRFAGYRGDRPVRLKVRFDASCFRDGTACPHIRNVVLFVEGG